VFLRLNEKFLKIVEGRQLTHILDGNGDYSYKMCNNCGYPLYINPYARYGSNTCSQCNEEFDIFDLLHKNSLMFLSNENQ